MSCAKDVLNNLKQHSLLNREQKEKMIIHCSTAKCDFRSNIIGLDCALMVMCAAKNTVEFKKCMVLLGIKVD